MGKDSLATREGYGPLTSAKLPRDMTKLEKNTLLIVILGGG